VTERNGQSGQPVDELQQDGASANGSTNGVETAQEPTIESVMAERDDYLDRLQRSVAEFQNFRRRVDADRERMREVATRDVLKSVLPVLDDLQRAVVALPEGQRDAPLGEGLMAIVRKFAGVLERNGVSAIDQVGEPFDPAKHEAVATEPGSGGSVVVEIYQTGYAQGESLLRPAMVKVGDPVQMQA